MSDPANLQASPIVTEQPPETYLQSAYRLVSDAISGTSSVDTAAVAQDTVLSATTAVQGTYESAPAVLSGVEQAQEQKEKEESAAMKSEAERRDARIQATKAAAPSSESRIGKTQQEIGTEHSIPTSAGPGSTLSRDAKALEAVRPNDGKAAHVPQDYPDEPCPSTFVTGEAKDNITATKGVLSSEEVIASPPARPADEEEQLDATPAKGKKTSFSEKLKGNAKILSGKLGRNHDKVELGKSIKRGD